MSTSVSHSVPLIPQPTPTSCWAAGIAMLTGRTVAQVQASTPPDLISSSGGLRNFSNREDWLTDTRRFAAAHKLEFCGPMSWSAEALFDQLSYGPMVFDMLWNSTDYTTPVGQTGIGQLDTLIRYLRNSEYEGSAGHVICVTGMSGTGASRTITYNDPWPPTKGATTTTNYNAFVQSVTTRTYRTFWQK